MCVRILVGVDFTAPLLRWVVLGKLDWGVYRVGGGDRPTKTMGPTPIRCIAGDWKGDDGIVDWGKARGVGVRADLR